MFAKSFLLAAAAAAPLGIMASPAPAAPSAAKSKAPAFILAGDSTTAPDGGWGDGFLSFVADSAFGKNLGHGGATTVSFREGGDWANVLDLVKSHKTDKQPYVTIQFGHNDQKPAKNISHAMFQSNLEKFANEVKQAGGTPLLVTSLTRRNFTGAHKVQHDLAAERELTIAAAKKVGADVLDLNHASQAYVEALGEEAAHAYNRVEGDMTHLNEWGGIVFGRMVADLMIEKVAMAVEPWIRANQTMSDLIAEGQPA